MIVGKLFEVFWCVESCHTTKRLDKIAISGSNTPFSRDGYQQLFIVFLLVCYPVADIWAQFSKRCVVRDIHLQRVRLGTERTPVPFFLRVYAILFCLSGKSERASGICSCYSRQNENLERARVLSRVAGLTLNNLTSFGLHLCTRGSLSCWHLLFAS